MARAHCLPVGAGSRTFGKAAGVARNGMGATSQTSCTAKCGRPRGVGRISSALRSCDGRTAGKAAIGAAAGGYGRAHAGRSCSDAGLADRHGEVAVVCGPQEISGEVAMLCDKYKEALIEAAASGAALPGGLREHVEVCAICGARLAAERTLFAAIDGGLDKAANAKVRSSFLPNV